MEKKLSVLYCHWICYYTYLLFDFLKNKAKHKEWILAQQKYAACINLCISRILNGESLSTSNVGAELNSSIKNEAIRKAKKAVADYRQGLAKKVPTFKSRVPISINNQNWDTKCVKGKWYVGFVVDKKKKYLPVEENEFVTRFSNKGLHTRGNKLKTKQQKSW
ncbi:hypothetical protein PP175_18585 [Aneurinibacillus sp. Ricciae_BoGa-3]|uniref:hypothetical protein n=1 Tax=Aneurinibacillus sp. Ricciae_BoGa-3 TaxID=3022697 RepID=UPI00233FF85B|nr:hypothetical protein [Aneurinibacillus sp. Ricciae_BoGa-3]WCK53344.1 hypothetical protein PP175_18585 [Aneurinibacillus sp. Ricciae_BoGa-3]